MKRGHSWYSIVRIPWLACAHCGLLRLRNERTEAAVRKACPGGDE